jgi:hypothetical protein
VATLVVPELDLTYPSLGKEVCEFIEAKCVFGPGSLQEQPAKLDAEKTGLTYRCYEVQPKGHPLEGNRHFDRCGVELRKGLAKTEWAAWIMFCELHPEGPVRFDGWDAWGRPVGRPVVAPYIPMMASTEEQVTELAFGVLKYIVEHCEDAHLFDCSKERIVRLDKYGREDGMAVPVSVAPNARDGARTTCQHFDEPHRIYLPRQREAHQTMNENLNKRQLEDPWSLYTSTAGAPGQGSIQEDLRSEAEEMGDGQRKTTSLFFFSRWADEKRHKDLDTVEKRVAAIEEATGPIGEWGKGQFIRIAKGYDNKGTDRMYWERVWLNRWRKSGAAAFDSVKVKKLATPTDLELKTGYRDQLMKGAFVAVGFDGAKFRDSTAIVLTEILTGKQQLHAIWERPLELPPDALWEVDSQELSETMAQVYETYDVWRGYCDPPYWTEVVANWAGKWPDQVIEWWTNRLKPMAFTCRAYNEAIDGETIKYVGPQEKRDKLVQHIGHAGRKDLNIVDDQGKPLWILQKLNNQEQNKFDACMAGVLSWQARLDAIAAGAQPRQKVGAPRRLY